MSKLNLLVIQDVPPKKKDGWFNTVGLEAYNSLQLFMHFFKKTEIDGAGKLTIYVGEKPEDKPVYFYDEKFKIAVYYVDEQTVQKRKDLKPEEWDSFYLGIIENTLTDIAKRAQNEAAIPFILEAVENVKATGFELLIPVKKLSKQSPDRLFKANTYRLLTPQGELDYVEITDKNKETERYEISKGYTKFPLDWAVQKCEWEGSRFMLKHNLSTKPEVYIDADKKTMYSLFNRELN